MIRVLGTYSFSKFGTVFGPSWLSASDTEFKLEWLFKQSYTIPIEHIVGLKPLVVFPWWAWGIQIDHNFPSIQSPIYFGTGFVRPSRIISQLANLSFNTNTKIDFTTNKGVLPC